MCEFSALGVSWPPCGWDHLEHIKSTNAQAISKDPATARVVGLSYSIEPYPVALQKGPTYYIYTITIRGWEYTINNESREYPILSFLLQERTEKAISPFIYISDIKVKARPLKRTQRSAARSFMVANVMMKQIIAGQVPDAQKLLRLYKIHPSQHSLYDISNIEDMNGFEGESILSQGLASKVRDCL